MIFCRLFNFKKIALADLLASSLTIAAPAFADCTNPSDVEGAIIYNGNYKTVQYCDGANWIAMGGGGSDALSGLSDVDTTGVADGNCLVYNNTSGKWEDGACGGSETDPQVGAVTNANWCVGDGSAVQCNQSAPVVSETDPEIGTLTASKWCASNAGGTAIDCTSNAPGLPTCSEGEGLILTSGAWACSQDTTPDAFSFTDQTGVATSTLTTSNSLTITGISASASVNVSVSGQGSPQVKINGGAWTTSGTIQNNQSLQVRLTSAATDSTKYSATVTVGTVSDQWDVTTGSPCLGASVGGYCWFIGGGRAARMIAIRSALPAAVRVILPGRRIMPAAPEPTRIAATCLPLWASAAPPHRQLIMAAGTVVLLLPEVIATGILPPPPALLLTEHTCAPARVTA